MKQDLSIAWLKKGISAIFSLSLLVVLYIPVQAQEVGFYLDGVIPDRDPQTSPYLVDLSDFYTAPLDNDWLVSISVNLHNLPKGIQTFAGVQWDVRGIVQLAGTSLLGASTLSAAEKAKQYPQSKTGIPIGLKAEKIYFLHASSWSAANLQKVGEYVVHYANGSKQSIPLLYQEALIDWWCSATAKPTNADIAWHGSHAKSEVSLFKYTWVNPSPQQTIDSIDFVSAMSSASPFMIALTCDPGTVNTAAMVLHAPVFSGADCSVQIIDVRGRIHRSFTGRDPYQTVKEDRNTPSGLYFIHVVSQHGDFIRPICITH
jgi:hypothetical protein